MYIKIKHIKKMLLVSACIFFAGFNYLTYVKADNASENANAVCDKAIDTDCDGLTNAEEKLYGTDASKSDTDNDGYSDGVEIKSGYDPTKPAPGDRVMTSAISDDKSAFEITSSNESLSVTTEFVEKLKRYTDDKDGQSITKEDVQSFTQEALAEKNGAPITWTSLPNIDRSQVKTLPQQYAALSENDRKIKLQKDAETYLTKASYIIISNLPNTIQNSADLQFFADEFMTHLASISSSNPDTAYFNDLGSRLEVFSNQLGELEVPETMIDIHINFLRLISGFLSLREINSPHQDPLAQTIMINKIQDLTELTSDFFSNDFQGYFNKIQIN